MFFFDTLKKILSGEMATLAYSASATQTAYTSVVDTLPYAAATPAFDAATATGYFTELHQKRSLSLSNGTVIGHLAGGITELLGTTRINAFEGLPDWLPSLSIRLTLTVTEGSCRATVQQPDGRLIHLTAPGSLEAQVAVKGGRLSFSIEALPLPAKRLGYEITII